MKKTIISFIAIAVLSFSCENCNISAQYQYQQPIDLGDGLTTASIEQTNLNLETIARGIDRIGTGRFQEVHSMLIYKDGNLVLEEYFEGHRYQWDAPGHYGEYVTWDRTMQHCIHSDTKSIVSLCIGIAIDQGFIESVQQSIFDYLPNYQEYNVNNKEYITIEHLLTMTSGLRWEEWGKSLGSVENDQIGIWFWEDGPMNYVLSRDFVAEPGTRFNYSGGDIQILVEVLENASGMRLDEFSRKYLFEPLGIATFDWWLIFPNGGQIQGAGGLKMTPRDMVKVGALMLNNGSWNGEQIISEDWIDKCKIPFQYNRDIKVPGEDLGKLGYSYTWWTKEFSYGNEMINLITAIGWGGQKIMIFPELDMVVVFTGANYDSNVHNFKIIERYILPSLY